MRIEANRKQLLDAFKHVATLAGGVKEILGYILLDADANQLFATNMELAVGHSFSKSGDGGCCLLHAQRVGSILQELSCEVVRIETTDNGIRISGGDGEFSLPTANVDEYPKQQPVEAEHTASIDANLLRQVVAMCSPCIDDSNGRFALGGVRVEVTEDGLRFVATDGRRLVKIGPDGDAIASAVVPVKALQLACKSAGPLSVSIGKDAIELDGDGCIVSARLIEGRYPDWRKVIPKKGGPEFSGASQDWLRAVRQAAICCVEESRGVDLLIAESKATMQAKNADVGASRCDVDCEASGKIAATIDWRYLADFLKGSGDTVFNACTVGPSSPIRFDIGEDVTFVLMPMSKDA